MDFPLFVNVSHHSSFLLILNSYGINFQQHKIARKITIASVKRKCETLEQLVKQLLLATNFFKNFITRIS